MDPLAILAGFVVGAIVGITGVGGGSLLTPLLIGVFRLNPASAIGTDLWFAAFTKSGGSIAHHRLGRVDQRVTALLLAGSRTATLATVACLHWSGGGPQRHRALTVAPGIALLLTALSVGCRQAWAALDRRLERGLRRQRQAVLTVTSGVLLGVVVSLRSIGATLLLLCPRLAAQRIVGTDIAHPVPLPLVAGIGHATLGRVDRPLLGSWRGARPTRRLPEIWVRSALCLSLTATGPRVLA